MAGRAKHAVGVHDDSTLSCSLASSSGKVPILYRCVPANRLFSESFVSNGSSPWPDMEQQSHRFQMENQEDSCSNACSPQQQLVQG